MITVLAACKPAPPPTISNVARPEPALVSCATLRGRLIDAVTQEPLIGGVVMTSAGDMAITERNDGEFVLRLTKPAVEATIYYADQQWPVRITACRVEWRVTRELNVPIEIR